MDAWQKLKCFVDESQMNHKVMSDVIKFPKSEANSCALQFIS
jgi:microsomal dipeptidase-like Zn-dependent dipeptidase